MLQRRVGGTRALAHSISPEVKLKLRSCSIYWPEGVAVLISHEDNLKLRYVKVLVNILARGGGSLIPHEDQLKLRSCSIHWPEGGGSFDLS